MKLNPNCSELVIRLPLNITKKRAIKELKKIGIYFIDYPANDWYHWVSSKPNETVPIILDLDNPNMPDFENTASMHIYGNRESDGYETQGVRIQCHQHCQHQLFPTVKKIIDHFPNSEIGGQDGGSTFDWDDWIEKGCKKIKNYQSKENRKKRDDLLKRPDLKL